LIIAPFGYCAVRLLRRLVVAPLDYCAGCCTDFWIVAPATASVLGARNGRNGRDGPRAHPGISFGAASGTYRQVSHEAREIRISLSLARCASRASRCLWRDKHLVHLVAFGEIRISLPLGRYASRAGRLSRVALGAGAAVCVCVFACVFACVRKQSVCLSVSFCLTVCLLSLSL
jgi:hypothetical protein